jgi:hypothetical protein
LIASGNAILGTGMSVRQERLIGGWSLPGNGREASPFRVSRWPREDRTSIRLAALSMRHVKEGGLSDFGWYSRQFRKNLLRLRLVIRSILHRNAPISAASMGPQVATCS